MSVRAVAKAAYEASQSDRVEAARAAMISLLGDPELEFSTMTVAAVETPPNYSHTLVVFADDDSDVRLAVRAESDGSHSVWLVADQDGWTMLGEQVKSLEHLWVLIDTHLPEPGTTVPAWDTQVAYVVGDQVTYNGETFECQQAHQSQAGWEPPNVPALWVRA